MGQEEHHRDDRSQTPQPFFSGGAGDPTLSYGSVGVGPRAQIGPYKLVGILGEGGYGIVYLAEQNRPIRRRVALKIVKPGMDSKQVIARFEGERQALALLDHPNLAHVHDAGTTDTGRPYFAMEYIEGLPITEYCDREKLDIRQRLRLFRQVCNGVQHAHQKGIIHRDLKPSNILVTSNNEEALVKVIDFGIAKAMAQPLTEKTLYTQQGQFIGTPDYMSPEQAEMDAQGIDTRADVYSLGVVLYELLTGVLPFDPEELRTGGLAHVQAVLRDQAPETPSTRLTGLGDEAKTIAARRSSDPRKLARSLLRELEWIPLKAMRKDSSRRYQSASQLADDIERYLDGTPLSAGPESVLYRIRKLAQRHQAAAVAAAVVTASLVIGFVVTSRMYMVAEKARRVAETSQGAEATQRQTAEKERNRALEAEDHARTLLAESYEQQGRQLLKADRLDEALVYLIEALRITSRLSTRILLAEGIRRYESPLPLETTKETAAWPISKDNDHTQRFVVSPDRNLYAFVDNAQDHVNIYETNQGQLQCQLAIPDVEQFIITPDNRHVVARTVQNGDRHWLNVFDLESGLQVGRISRANVDVNDFYENTDSPMPVPDVFRKMYSSILIGPAADWFAFPDLIDTETGQSSVLKLWDLTSGQLRATSEHRTTAPLVTITASFASPYSGGRQLFAIDCNHAVHRWYLPSLEYRDSFKWSMWFASFNPNGSQHLSHEDGRVELMDRRGNVPVLILDRVGAIGFSPNGKILVTRQWPDPCDVIASHEGFVVSLWNTETGELTNQLPHSDVVNWHFTPDSERLITEHADGRIRIWWSGHGTLVFQTPALRSLKIVDLGWDGQTLLTEDTARPDRLQLWELTTGDSCELTVPDTSARDLSEGLSLVEMDGIFESSLISPRKHVKLNRDGTHLITATGLRPIWMRMIGVDKLKAFVEASVDIRLENGRLRQASKKEILSSRLNYYQACGHFADSETIETTLDLVTLCIQEGQLNEARQTIERLKTTSSIGDPKVQKRMQELTRRLSKAYLSRGILCDRQGRYSSALSDLESSVALQPRDSCALRTLAWVQTICPENNLPEMHKALENSKEACVLTSWEQWDCVSTYAVALASNGLFSEAVRWQEEALRLLPEKEQRRWRANFEQRLSLFQRRTSYEQRYFWDVSTRHLVGWWKFDRGSGGVAKDSSGDDLDGTLVGHISWELDSSRTALGFAGHGSYVDCGAHSMFDITDAMTVTAWIKAPSRSDVPWAFIASKKGWSLEMNCETGTLVFFCEGLFTSVRNLSYYGIAGKSVVETDRWCHVAVVYDGTRLYLYRDGHQYAVEQTSGKIAIRPGMRLLIGGHPEESANCWTGLIDDVRIYKRALSAEEVVCLYEQTKK